MAQRNTAQQTATLCAVRALANHPTADRVYRYVHTLNPRISRATVYRNLNKLCLAGQLTRVKIPGSADRFDHRTCPHYHFICEKCGKVEDMDIEYMEQINRMSRGIGGRKVNRHTILFEGICARCLDQ